MSTSRSSIDLVLDQFPKANETNEMEESLRPRKLCMCWRSILVKDQQNLCDYRILHFLELTYCTFFKAITNSNMPSVKLGLIVICEIEFFSVVSVEYCLFEALGHQASPFKTSIVFQIEYEICYGNILQITIRAGCIVTCEIKFFSVVSVELCLLQALGHKASPFKTIIALHIQLNFAYFKPQDTRHHLLKP